MHLQDPAALTGTNLHSTTHRRVRTWDTTTTTLVWAPVAGNQLPPDVHPGRALCTLSARAGPPPHRTICTPQPSFPGLRRPAHRPTPLSQFRPNPEAPRPHLRTPGRAPAQARPDVWHSQLRMSEMKTARPRIPSPLETAGILATREWPWRRTGTARVRPSSRRALERGAALPQPPRAPERRSLDRAREHARRTRWRAR